MTARIAVVRQGGPGRALLLGGVVSAVLAGALARELSQSSPAALTGGRAGATASSPGELAALPPAARASISVALGADYPEYRFSSVGTGFQATNKAEGLAVSAGGAGVSVRARRLVLGLRLQALGYGSALRAVDRPAPRAAANRVTYAHAGGVSEWYANGPAGLEQGFTVARPPAPAAAGPLTLAIALAGNAHASLAAGGQSATFTAAGGGSLSYAGLAVTDAGGRALRATIALAPGRLLLRVDARHARFPLRIDPTVTEVAEPEVTEQTLAPTPDTQQRAGVSVALSADGNTAFVGGPRGDGTGGAVWVFERKGSAEFTQDPTPLTAPSTDDGQPMCEEHRGRGEVEGCSFGSAVALSADGHTALVGDPHESVTVAAARGPKTLEHAGVVYVYTRSEGPKGEVTWAPATKLQSPEPSTQGAFGSSVALSEDGEAALVGAPGEEKGAGLAWVFTGAGAAWKARQVLEGTHEETEARFGKSVALSGDGDVAVVGAPSEDEQKGAVWVFEGSPAAGFQRGMSPTSSELQTGSQFGHSVAVSGEGDVLMVGAPRFDGSATDEETGAAWVFVHSGAEWTQMGAKLTGPGEDGERFGYSVALSANGQTAMVGAPHALEGLGDAWLYENVAASWGASVRQERASEEQGRAGFGASVASSATAEPMLVGSPGNARREGEAWIVGRGPAITRVAPAAGSPYGGTVVTIEGQHFNGATAVTFGDVPAEWFEEKSSRVIMAAAPPGAGMVYVKVQTAHGTSEAKNHQDEFTYEPPVIERVEPGSGKPAGGEAVTITGKYFTGATAVYFGNTAAASMKVESEGVIKAVSPPAEVGVVHITVRAPFGTSLETTADRFIYENGAENNDKRETEPGGNPPGNLPGETSPNAGGTPAASAGVLAAGPLGTPTCRASLLAARIFVERSRLAVLKLVGRGAGSCRGRLRLRVRVKHKGKHSALQTIGTGVFAITAGKRVTVQVALTRTGRALLAAGHGRLTANLLIVRSSPMPALAQTATVHLAPQPKRAKPGHKT